MTLAAARADSHKPPLGDHQTTALAWSSLHPLPGGPSTSRPPTPRNCSAQGPKSKASLEAGEKGQGARSWGCPHGAPTLPPSIPSWPRAVSRRSTGTQNWVVSTEGRFLRPPFKVWSQLHGGKRGPAIHILRPCSKATTSMQPSLIAKVELTLPFPLTFITLHCHHFVHLWVPRGHLGLTCSEPSCGRSLSHPTVLRWGTEAREERLCL